MYKLYINDRNYTTWEIFDTIHFTKIEININPIESKLFSNDVFSVDESNQVILLHSSIRCETSMPGVLILTGNKTYGRHLSKGKLLYKCVPDDVRLPSFLVPYEIKNVGFSKVLKNLYVTITFDKWEEKHPVAKLNNVIGSVDILDNFYEYQLYCKSLHSSIQKFQKDTTKSIESKSHEGIIETIKLKYPNIQDRTNQKVWHSITIDPPKSQDFDDAFSIIQLENGIQQLSVYISNVSIWMDALHLWDSFSRRISTIYLPDKKRPMLPTILSDCLCSLQENVTRIAFAMDLFIQNNEIIDIKYANCFIKVSNNYCYEEPKLLADANYHLIFDAVSIMSTKSPHIGDIKNSHEVVSYLMVLMNYNCAKKLIQYKTGIFRSTISKREFEVPDTVPEDVGKFIKLWNSASGQYINWSDIADTRHEILDMDAYIHITSPIRRLVDLLNMIQLQQVSEMVHFTEQADAFYNKWLGDIDYINITMRSIRKVQGDCTLLDLCHTNPDVMDKEYNGYLFDKIIRNDGLYQYLVFLPELKLSSRLTMREDMDNYSCKKCKLFLFNDEENFKKKIRIHLL